MDILKELSFEFPFTHIALSTWYPVTQLLHNIEHAW